MATTDPPTGSTLYRVRVEPDDYDNPSPREATNIGVLVLHSQPSTSLPCEGNLTEEIIRRLDYDQDSDRPPPTNDPIRNRFLGVAEWLIAQHGARVVLPVWGSYEGSRLSIAAGDRDGTPPDPTAGLLGVIYDSPHTHARADLSDVVSVEDLLGIVGESPHIGPQAAIRGERLIAELLQAEVEMFERWRCGELFRFVIEARDGQDWHFFTEDGGFYSREEAHERGVAAVPQGYPWFSGTGGRPVPGDRYEGATVVAISSAHDAPPAPANTAFVLLLVRVNAPYYAVVVVDERGTEHSRTEHNTILSAAQAHSRTWVSIDGDYTT